MTWNLFVAHRKSARKFQRPSRPSFRLCVENLEGRWVPSVNHIIFTIDPASTLTLSGTFAGTTLMEQIPGSLTTTLSGTQAVDYDPAAQTIQFDTSLNDSTSTAAIFAGGNLQPDVGGGDGSAPADFGGFLPVGAVTIYAAVRGSTPNSDSTSNVSSDVLPLNSDGTFDATSQMVNLTGGNLDYNASAFGSGSAPLANTSATNMATTPGMFLDQGGDRYQCSLPINVTYPFSFGGLPATFTVIGTLTANAAIPTVTLNNGTVGGNDFATTFSVSGGGPVNLTDPGAMISSNSSNQTLQSLTITLTNNPDGLNEFLDADVTVSSSPLTKVYNPSTGTLTISGTGSYADYTAVLDTVVYNDTNVSIMSDRFITFVAFDGVNQNFVSTTDLSFVP
jgi:hypothetical protein